MPVVTVSSSRGSAYHEIATAVAAELKIDFVDQEILVEAARELGVSLSEVAGHDEHLRTLGERIASILRGFMERTAAVGTTDPFSGGGLGLDMLLAHTYGEAAELPTDTDRGQLNDERYIKTLTSVISAVAARGNVLIVGRGSQLILQHEPDTTHVFITAPREARIAAIAAQEQVPASEAAHRMKHSDHDREEFYRRYFKVQVQNPELYDLTIRGGGIRNELAVRLICEAVRDRAARPG